MSKPVCVFCFHKTHTPVISLTLILDFCSNVTELALLGPIQLSYFPKVRLPCRLSGKSYNFILDLHDINTSCQSLITMVRVCLLYSDLSERL